PNRQTCREYSDAHTCSWPSRTLPARRRSLAEVLQQLAALFGALPARRGAGGHVLVVRELPAGRGALVAARRAALQHGAGEGALAGAQGRTGLAALGAVGAELRRLGVVLFAIGQQRQAVGEAGVALELTVRARLGTFQEVLGVFVLGTGRRPERSNDGDGQRGRHQGNGTHDR